MSSAKRSASLIQSRLQINCPNLRIQTIIQCKVCLNRFKLFHRRFYPKIYDWEKLLTGEVDSIGKFNIVEVSGFLLQNYRPTIDFFDWVRSKDTYVFRMYLVLGFTEGRKKGKEFWLLGWDGWNIYMHLVLSINLIHLIFFTFGWYQINSK